MGLYGVDIRDYGASPANPDNSQYIADAAAAAGDDKTLIIPDGVFQCATTPITVTNPNGIHIFSTSDAAVLLATAAHPLIKIDATNNHLSHGSISNVRLASIANSPGYDGIRIVGGAWSFINGWRFRNIRFSGLNKGFSIAKGEYGYGGGPNVSLVTGNFIANWHVDEWGANRSQWGLHADGLNTMSILGGYSRAMMSTVEIGDGQTGLGDFFMEGVHTNFGQIACKILGSYDGADYRHNIVVTGNQFDGDNACNIWARNLRNYEFAHNSEASGVQNDIQDCWSGLVSWTPAYVEDAVTKEGVGSGQAVFQLRPPSTGNAAAVVEIEATGYVGGKGPAVWSGKIPVAWKNGAASFGAADVRLNYGVDGAVAPVGCYSSGGSIVFGCYHNGSASGTRLVINVKASGDGFQYLKC
jgi:hypothetical protein